MIIGKSPEGKIYSGVFCVGSGGLNDSKTQDGDEFDPTFNPNVCMKLTDEFIEKVRKMATQPLTPQMLH